MRFWKKIKQNLCYKNLKLSNLQKKNYDKFINYQTIPIYLKLINF